MWVFQSIANYFQYGDKLDRNYKEPPAISRSDVIKQVPAFLQKEIRIFGKAIFWHFNIIQCVGEQMIPWLSERYGAQRMSYVMVGVSQLIFPLSFIYANDHKMHTMQTTLIRGIVSMLLNLAIVRYYGMSLDYKYDVNLKNIFKRNVIVIIHGLALTSAQFYLPLPIVHTINFFAPIFVFIIDYLQNGVYISRRQFYFLLLSVVGLLCTVNSELVTNLLDPNHEMKTQFKNYIKLSPGEFSLYGLALISIMFLWAYGLLRVRTYYKNNHTFVNFQFGLLLSILSGFLYPYQVQKKTPWDVLLVSIFTVGLPLAVGQLLFVAGLALNKKTGQIVILTGIPVLMGYLVSYFRYGETIELLELTGSILILVGLMGVINCADEFVELPITSKFTSRQSSKRLTSDVFHVVQLA